MEVNILIPNLKMRECEAVGRELIITKCSGKKSQLGRVVVKDVRQDSIQMNIIIPNLEWVLESNLTEWKTVEQRDMIFKTDSGEKSP